MQTPSVASRKNPVSAVQGSWTAAALIAITAASAVAAGVGVPDGPCRIGGLFDEGAAYSRTLHVATWGSDSTGNGTPAAPYATLRRAAQLATPGTQIILHEGTYTNSNYITNLQGTATEPIRISAAEGEGPAILDRMGSGNEAIHLVDARYVIIENLVIRRALDNGINIDDGGSYATPSEHIILRNLTVEDIGTGGNHDGIKLSGVDHIYVLGCLIQRIRSGSGIDMVGCHHSIIAYNEFRDGGSNATQTKGGSEDILILGNLCVDAGARAFNMGGSTGAPYFRPIDAPFEAKNIRAIGNVIVGSDAAVAYVSLVDGLAANNTIYLPTRWVLRILNENTSKLPTQNGRFCNNIVWFRQSMLSTYVNIGPNTLPETFQFCNNLWYAEDNPGFSGPSLPAPETDGIYQIDPQFTVAGQDFHLLRSSPARAAGKALTELEGDRDARRFLSRPTLGAYEIGLDGDVDGNGTVDVFDAIHMVNAFGRSAGEPGYNRFADFDLNGTVDVADVVTLVNHFGESDD